MSQAYLSLGSNLGDRLGYLVQTVQLLEAAGIQVRRSSAVYETAPQGKTDQPLFLNLVLDVETTLSPLALLRQIQTVEQQLGRERTERWGPRTADVDILLYESLGLSTPELELPHPRMTQRSFVLVPLLELEPDLVVGGQRLAAVLEALEDQGVHLFLDAGAFLSRVRGVQ